MHITGCSTARGRASDLSIVTSDFFITLKSADRPLTPSRGDLPNGAAGHPGTVLCGNALDDWAEVSRLSRHSLVRRRKVIVVALGQ